jgi:hypothetical protein
VELHAFAQLEGIREPVFCDGPGLGKIAFDRRILGRVEFQQRVVMRPHRMNERKGRVRVAVIVRRLRAHRKLEQATASRRLFGRDRRRDEQGRRDHQ